MQSLWDAAAQHLHSVLNNASNEYVQHGHADYAALYMFVNPVIVISQCQQGRAAEHLKKPLHS